MNNCDSFYVTLRSDGSRSVYPSNHAGKFKNDMCIPRNLDSGWEVALVQAHVPNTFAITTPEFNFVVWRGLSGTDMSKPRPNGYVASDQELNLMSIGASQLNIRSMGSAFVTIPSGRWFNVQHLGNFVAGKIRDSFRSSEHSRFEVYYSRRLEEKSSEFVTNDRSYLGVSATDDTLFEILGIGMRDYETRLLLERNTKVYMFDSRAPRDVNFPNSSTIMLHSDIVEAQEHGGTLAKVIGVMPIIVERSKTEVLVFDNAKYLPVVSDQQLKCIEVRLTDVFNNMLQFPEDFQSHVIVQLHFRKRASSRHVYYPGMGGWC